MTRSTVKKRDKQAARKKANAYRAAGRGRPDLADFVSVSADIAKAFADATRRDKAMPYDAPPAVLRRSVYKYGQAYADADMAAELREYVEEWTGPARGLKADNTFGWLIRLVTLVHTNPALAPVSQSTWSKMAPVLELARGLDVHRMYLEHFIAMGGRMDGILKSLDPDEPPRWVNGLTRSVQAR